MADKIESRLKGKWWITFWLSLIPLVLSIILVLLIGNKVLFLLISTSFLSGILAGRLWDDFYIGWFEHTSSVASSKEETK